MSTDRQKEKPAPKDEPHAEPEELYQELQEKTALADQYLARLKYLQAEFENYQKIVARERQLYQMCATEGLIKRILPILDTLEAALTSAQACRDLPAFMKGIALIYRDLLDALGQEGVKPIKAVGEKYDPYKHEVTMTVLDAAAPEDTVVEEVERGYMLGTKVLRSSKVIIARRPESTAGTTD